MQTQRGSSAWICLLAWPLCMSLPAQAQAQAQALSVPTATAQPARTPSSTELEGLVEAVRQSTVAAQTNGRVIHLHAKVGDAVRAGQLLATLDDREALAAAQQSAAQYEQADAALRSAQQQLRRSQDLRNQGFVSQAALDAAQVQYDSALAQKKQAVGANAQTGLAQGYSRITAPFDGYVRAVNVEVGDLATTGKPLFTLYAPQPLRVVVQVPASRLAAVMQAKNVQLQVGMSDSPWLQPTSKTAVPSADPIAQTTELRLHLAPADSTGLVPGQQARVRYNTSVSANLNDATTSTNALQVPQQAVVQRGELTAVYVWTGQAFSLRPVRVGSGSSGQALVLSGLRAGDKVALDPVRAANVQRP